MFVNEIEEHLRKQLIPFWEGMADKLHGGFYGLLDYQLQLDRRAVKGVILNSRILWFFSNAYEAFKEPELLAYADHAYRFLRDYCLDKEEGGVFWSMTYDGGVEDDSKHTYNQAFAVYALSSYYRACRSEEALMLADSLFELIETRCCDEVGYGEAYDRSFHPVVNEKLSENGVIATRTMNTLLHVFEAYTEYYQVTGSRRAAKRLRAILEMFATKVYNPKRQRLEVFFNDRWESLIDLHSYGHDIEASWLIDRGLTVLGGEEPPKLKQMVASLAAEIYRRAFKNGSILNECEAGRDDTDRIWWVQAEAIVGFLNAWENQPESAHYLEAAGQIWTYIRDYMIDKRKGSEWFWRVDEAGQPIPGSPLVDPWKCPYHNGRMCLEVMKWRSRHLEELV